MATNGDFVVVVVVDAFKYSRIAVRMCSKHPNWANNEDTSSFHDVVMLKHL